MPETTQDWIDFFSQTPDPVTAIGLSVPPFKPETALLGKPLSAGIATGLKFLQKEQSISRSLSAGSKAVEVAAKASKGEEAFARLFQAGAIAGHELKPGTEAWLTAHEGINGSHTIGKHVGKSIGAMKSRLKYDPKIDITGSFPDLKTASEEIWNALKQNQETINKSIAKGSKKVDFIFDAGHPVGKVLERDEKTALSTNKLQVILRPDGHGGLSIYSAFPCL